MEHGGRDADGGRRQLDDDLPGAGTALAGLVLLVRPGRPPDRTRIRAQVFDSLLDGIGIFALWHGAALRRERQRDAGESYAAPGVASNPLFWIGGGLFLVGLAFKLSLVPFHVWSPDVYEGAPLPVTAFMSVVTKAGTLAVFARFAYAAVPAHASAALLIPFFIIAGISMIAGNLGMLAQTDMKRLLAYSGIAQIGYIVAALAGGTALGMRYAIYYLVAYMFMNLGAFAVVALLSSDKEEGRGSQSFHGLAQRRPVLAAVMTFFLLALAGFPPTAGFLGKILILSTNVSAGFRGLRGCSSRERRSRCTPISRSFVRCTTATRRRNPCRTSKRRWHLRAW